MKKNYKHIFFDLDRTLWDFEANASLALKELFEIYELKEKGIFDFDFFVKVYKNINRRLWEKLRDGKVTKDFLRTARFKDSLLYFGVADNNLAEKMGNEYVKRASEKKQLIPYTREILAYLYPKYTLHIITNGFEEAQYMKLKNCDLWQYFSQVVLSENVGVSKPHKKIFQYALYKAGSAKEDAVMIGDDIVSDIKGALDFGIDAVYFNPENKAVKNKLHPTYVIQNLKELEDIF